MQKSLSDAVLVALKPKTFYRAGDLAVEMFVNVKAIHKSLSELARGGLIEKIKENNRVVYITKQQSLF